VLIVLSGSGIGASRKRRAPAGKYPHPEVDVTAVEGC
jgi:hypothetical protein